MTDEIRPTSDGGLIPGDNYNVGHWFYIRRSPWDLLMAQAFHEGHIGVSAMGALWCFLLLDLILM